MDNLEKFEKHIGKPVNVTIGGDEFEFKPVTFEQFGKLLILGSKFGGGEKFDVSKLDKDGVESMMGLFKSIVTNSYPELGEEKAEAFVVNNLEELGNVLEKLMPEMKTQADVEKIKQRVQQTKK